MDPLFELGLLIKAGQRDFERRPAEDDRRRIVLSLTARGRRLEKRIQAAREEQLELGHALIGERDLEPALRLLRELAQFSPYEELINRRRELYEGQRARTG